MKPRRARSLPVLGSDGAAARGATAKRPPHPAGTTPDNGVRHVLERYEFNEIVVQPGTFCNLACRYCYIPQSSRDTMRGIEADILERIASSLSALQPLLGGPVSILFHAGEPLVIGVERFRALLTPFEELRRAGAVRYAVQTNGTLIDGEWCEFFREYGFGVGVSVDGPPDLCGDRVNRGGRPAFPQIIRGVERLRSAGIPFGCVSVLSAALFEEGRSMEELSERIHHFFRELRPASVGFNVEEVENANAARRTPPTDRVLSFWSHLYRHWDGDRAYDVRDLSLAEQFAQSTSIGRSERSTLSLIPTVDTEGNVYFFSPEIVGTRAPQYGDFVVGNLRDVSLEEMIARIESVPYVRDFLDGVQRCRASCPAYEMCQSRHVLSNKFAENGDLRSTETSYCRNTYLAPLQAVLGSWACTPG
jgi:uncharacterized protein